jgi:putative transcriptional regulator
MSKAAYSKIAAGLQSVLDYVNGNTAGAVVHTFEAPDLNVSEVREKTKLSQEMFAATFGVSLGTLRGWEQRRRKPAGTARVLLTLIDRDPVSVLETLTGTKGRVPERGQKRQKRVATGGRRAAG